MVRSKKTALLLVVVILILQSLACSTLNSLTEETTISIISPDPNVRLVEEAHADGTPVQANIVVEMFTNQERYILATIYLDGVPKAEQCNLKPNDRTNCGTIDLYNKGQHTVKVVITDLSGEIIASEVTVLWEPYIGWDATALKLAKIAGSNSPTIGFILFGIFFMLTFATIFGLGSKNGHGQGAVFGIAISVIVLIALFIVVSPTVAADIFMAIISLLGTSIVFGVIIYGMSKGYGFFTKNGSYLSFTDGKGDPVVLDRNSRALLGNNAATDDAAIVAAILNASGGSNKQLNSGLNHYIDGQIVTEQEFKMQRNQTSAPIHRQTGFFAWLFQNSRRRSQIQQNQKRLR